MSAIAYLNFDGIAEQAIELKANQVNLLGSCPGEVKFFRISLLLWYIYILIKFICKNNKEDFIFSYLAAKDGYFRAIFIIKLLI